MITENTLQEPEPEIRLTDKQIFTEIWTTPRMVFRYINDNMYDKYVTILLIFAGIARAFDRASLKSMGDELPLIGIVGISVFLGGLLGWISFYIYAALLSWTGKWLNGQGNTKSLITMIAYASIPSILALVLLIPQIAFFGNEIFQSEIDVFGGGFLPGLVFYTSVLLEFTLAMWSIVILVAGIAEIQKLSIAKSILNLFLPAIIIIIPIFLIVLLIQAF